MLGIQRWTIQNTTFSLVESLAGDRTRACVCVRVYAQWGVLWRRVNRIGASECWAERMLRWVEGFYPCWSSSWCKCVQCAAHTAAGRKEWPSCVGKGLHMPWVGRVPMCRSTSVGCVRTTEGTLAIGIESMIWLSLSSGHSGCWVDNSLWRAVRRKWSHQDLLRGVKDDPPPRFLASNQNSEDCGRSRFGISIFWMD